MTVLSITVSYEIIREIDPTYCSQEKNFVHVNKQHTSNDYIINYGIIGEIDPTYYF